MTDRLVNYRLADDAVPQAGIIRDDRIHNLSSATGIRYPTLADAYDDWAHLDHLNTSGFGPLNDGIAMKDVVLLPPSARPGAIYFAGFNYHDHVANMKVVFNLPDEPDPRSIGLSPWHGLKPRNTLCGHDATVKLQTARTDWELELAVVIGTEARNVPVDRALEHVAGYTIAIDLSARDRAFRPHTPVESVARMDWLAQKGFEGACPLGPWLTPASMIRDPQNLTLTLSINGDLKQDSNTSQMIFSAAESIAHLSTLLPLSPGDIILTGTPAGTGAERGEALKPGDRLAASIEGLGELHVRFS